MHKKFTAAIASAALAMSIAICAVPGLPVMSAEVTETNPAAETKTQEQTRAAAPDTLDGRYNREFHGEDVGDNIRKDYRFGKNE